MVRLAQKLPDPLAERGGRAPQVDSDVVDLAGQHAHQLALRLLKLVVDTAQNATQRAGMVVLKKPGGQAQLLKRTFGVRLEEKAALVSKDLRLQQDDVGNGCRNRSHG